MIEIRVNIGDDILWVKGELKKAEPEIGIPESFEIDSIESDNTDILGVLEWANAQPKGSILEIIEGEVLKNLE